MWLSGLSALSRSSPMPAGLAGRAAPSPAGVHDPLRENLNDLWEVLNRSVLGYVGRAGLLCSLPSIVRPDSFPRGTGQAGSRAGSTSPIEDPACTMTSSPAPPWPAFPPEAPAGGGSDDADRRRRRGRISNAMAATTAPAASAPLAAPDLGPNVTVFDPSMSAATIQSRLTTVFNQQQTNPSSAPSGTPCCSSRARTTSTRTSASTSRCRSGPDAGTR